MTRKQVATVAALALLLAGAGLMAAWRFAAPETPPDAAAKPVDAAAMQIPVPGMVTMIDIGAGACVPCRLMEPILRQSREEYAGRAAIIFIDVYRKRKEITRYRIRAIPTQIFFDRSGVEVTRHEGFMDKEAIAEQLAKLGVK